MCVWVCVLAATKGRERGVRVRECECVNARERESVCGCGVLSAEEGEGESVGAMHAKGGVFSKGGPPDLFAEHEEREEGWGLLATRCRAQGKREGVGPLGRPLQSTRKERERGGDPDIVAQRGAPHAWRRGGALRLRGWLGLTLIYIYF